ncbi:MAG: hypothetical protein JSW59_01935, partial [Phycisphaerales bacterium]
MARIVMPRKLKLSKIAIVMFLTALIWVYSDQAVDDTHTVADVPISIASSGDTELWATFKNEDGPPLSTVTIEYIVLKGPSSRIAELKRELNNNPLKLAFSLNPELLNMTTAGSHTLNVLEFVRRREKIKGLGGITVESCEPNTLTVDVVKLIKRELDIQAVDENGRALESESISPSKISMYVPEDWGQDKAAEVALTPREIERARSEAIGKRPCVVLADNQQRQSADSVQIKLLPEEDRLGLFTITRVGVGYSFSANTQGKYEVQVQSDEAELRSEIKIRATLAAKEAYEKQRFHVTLEI